MKKRMIGIALILCVVLSACGKSELVNSDTGEEQYELTEPRAYNQNMTWDEYEQITNDLIGYSTDIGDTFTQMMSLCNKYSNEINSAETFDWSQYWDFRELESSITSKLEEILQYDDSKCSAEYQLCVDEFKNMAYEMLYYFTMISEERDIDELDTLTNNINNIVTQGMKQALIYQTEATIAYMEANDGDPDTIQNLKASIAENNSTNNIAHSSNSGIFTNSYGSATTKCAHNGCYNTIASSGDTNCCIVHSNKCLNCGKYIDEDALFCMDCLSGNNSTNKSGQYSSDNAPSGGCQYTYLDGTICGNKTNKWTTLCDKHCKELNDTNHSLVGK